MIAKYGYFQAVRPCPLFTKPVCVIGILFLSSLLARTQEVDADYHLFTPKQGNPIEAKLLNVSSDWTKMQIQNKEGRTFEVGTNLVSLDDQQYIKDWIKNKPTKSDFELDVKISKKIGSVDRKKYSGTYDLEKRDVTYSIEILNKSVETLPTPKVEYVVLMADGAEIYELSSGGWSYTSDETPDVTGVKGEVDFEDLTFNREQSITTTPLTVDKVVGDGNFVYGEDKMLGVLVRITTVDGTEVGLYRSSESGADRYTWEAAVEEVGGRNGRRRRMMIDPPGEARAPMSYSLVKSVKVEGPIDVGNRNVQFDATVSPSGNGSGVIVAVGGQVRGFGVYLQDRKIHVIQRNNGEEKIISAQTPLGEFKLSASLTADTLTLLVDGRSVAEDDSLGLFEGPTIEGIDTGLDSGPDAQKVGVYDGDFPFAGTIRNSTLVLSGDQ